MAVLGFQHRYMYDLRVWWLQLPPVVFASGSALLLASPLRAADHGVLRLFWRSDQGCQQYVVDSVDVQDEGMLS